MLSSKNRFSILFITLIQFFSFSIGTYKLLINFWFSESVKYGMCYLLIGWRGPSTHFVYWNSLNVSKLFIYFLVFSWNFSFTIYTICHLWIRIKTIKRWLQCSVTFTWRQIRHWIRSTIDHGNRIERRHQQPLGHFKCNKCSISTRVSNYIDNIVQMQLEFVVFQSLRLNDSIYLFLHSENQSSAVMWFDCNIYLHLKIFIHITSQARCPTTRRFHAMEKKVFIRKNFLENLCFPELAITLFSVLISGVGDSGDHWKVVCSEDFWMRSNAVKFYHIDTDVYLSVSGRTFGR